LSRAVTVRRVQSVGQAGETDLAQTMGRVKIRSLGISVETDLAFGIILIGGSELLIVCDLKDASGPIFELTDRSVPEYELIDASTVMHKLKDRSL